MSHDAKSLQTSVLPPEKVQPPGGKWMHLEHGEFIPAWNVSPCALGSTTGADPAMGISGALSSPVLPGERGESSESDEYANALSLLSLLSLLSSFIIGGEKGESSQHPNTIEALTCP